MNKSAINQAPTGKFNGSKNGDHMLGPIQKIDVPMRHFGPDEEIDFCIVGVGSAGGVLLQRLARAGFRWAPAEVICARARSITPSSRLDHA